MTQNNYTPILVVFNFPMCKNNSSVIDGNEKNKKHA
jgi:hypothetical protein